MLITLFLVHLVTLSYAKDLSYEFDDHTTHCLQVLLAKGIQAETVGICEKELCHLGFRKAGEADPCGEDLHNTFTSISELRARFYEKSLRRRLRRGTHTEDKELPQLEIIQHPTESLEVTQGSSTTLTCLAKSQKTDVIGYTWSFQDPSKIEAMPTNIQIQDNLLVISNITEENSGWYQCSAADGANRALSSKTRLNLVYFEDVFVAEPSDVSKPSGTLIIELTCSPPRSYPPAIVRWFKDGMELSDGNALQTPAGTLVIHHLTAANAGDYYCRAENELLPKVKYNSAAATVTVSEPEIQTEKYLPTEIWNGNNLYLNEGDTVTVTCGVYGEESPEIIWYKGITHQITDRLSSFPKITISDNQYELEIRDLELSDTAAYLCVCKNSLDGNGLPMSTNVFVVSDLRFSIPLTDKSLVKQDTFELVCEITGNPPVNIEWYADGQKLVKQNRHVDWEFDLTDNKGEFAVKSTLIVTNANVDDTGLYQCFGINDHQNVVDSASVFVSSVLSFMEAKFVTKDKMYVEDGEKGDVKCGAKGSPMPEVSWLNLQYKYKNSVTSTEGTSGLASTKEIKFPIGPLYLNESDQHVFTCVAENRHAGVEYKKAMEISVVVGYPVKFVNGTFPIVEVDKGASTILQCEFSGIPSPVVTWKRNGVRLPIVDNQGNIIHVIQADGALLVMEATNSDDTLFTCTGTNGFNSVNQAIQVIVLRTGMTIGEQSGVGIGILLLICLICLIMLMYYRYRQRRKTVDVAIGENGGIDSVHAHEKALAQLQREEEERKQAEKLRLQEIEKQQAEDERKRKAEEEKERLLQEQRKKEEDEAARILEEQLAQQAEEERLQKEAEEAERLRLEEEERQKKEDEEKALLEAEEKARLEAEEKARLEEEEAEKARLEAEEKAKLEAEEKAQLEAEEKARLEAEEKARLEEEEAEKARLEAEEKAKLEAEEKARLEAEEKARLEAEEAETARLEAEEKAQLEAEEKARLEAEEKARLEAEEKARLEAEEKARLEAEEKARLEAEEQARLEAEENARIDAEEKAQIEAAENARKEAEEQARIAAEQKALLMAQQKAHDEADQAERIRLEKERLMKEQEEAERLRKEEEERLRLVEEERLRKEAEEKARLEKERLAREAEIARLKAEEEARRIAEEERIREEEERIALLQIKEMEERKKREEEERLAHEMFEAEEAERKQYEKEQARIEAQRQLEEDTARAAAKQEQADRLQKEMHTRNKDMADKEFDAAKKAEQEAEKAVKESKSDREMEIANRMRDGALNRATRATINKDLADATSVRDIKKLKPAIKKAEKKKVHGTENYLLQAKKLYEQLQAATHLKGATFERRIADIEAAIHAIKKGGFETLLAVELLEAQVLLKKLKRIQKAALEVQNLSQQTIAIMKSYNRPPDVVTQVMRSVFLLLGNTSQELATWPDIVIQLNKIGKDNTKRRIQCCIPEDINYTSAKKVELILCKYDEELVFDTTQALGIFYNWAECIADERLALPQVLTEKHKSSGLFGAMPPLPKGPASLTNPSSSGKKKKPRTAPDEEKKVKGKKKGKNVTNGGLKVGADKNLPPPPKFLYNGT